MSNFEPAFRDEKVSSYHERILRKSDSGPFALADLVSNLNLNKVSGLSPRGHVVAVGAGARGRRTELLAAVCGSCGSGPGSGPGSEIVVFHKVDEGGTPVALAVIFEFVIPVKVLDAWVSSFEAGSGRVRVHSLVLSGGPNDLH